MSLRSRLYATAALVPFATLAAFAPPADAGALNPSTLYECDVSGTDPSGSLNPCPSLAGPGTKTTTNAVTGTLSSNPAAYACAGIGSYCGARSNSNASATVPVDVWNYCRWVDNASVNSIFVPFRTAFEWTQFINNKPAGVGLVPCGRPYAVDGTPATETVNAPYPNCTPPTVTVDAPNVYGRQATSLWPVPNSPSFTCNGNVTVTSQLQWTANDFDSIPHGAWSWNPKNQFSPNETLAVNGTTSTTVYVGNPVTLTWTWDASVQSCAASTTSDFGGFGGFGGWGGGFGGGGSWSLGFAGPGAEPGGSATVTPALGTTTYTLTCTGTDGLTSTASVTVNVVEPPPPPPTGGGGGGSCGGYGNPCTTGGHGGGCFLPGSLVLMADGQLRPIETLQFGDRVQNAHGGTNMVLRRELCALTKVCSVYGFDGGKPMVTALHPFVMVEGYAVIDPDGLREKYPYFEDEIGPVSRLQAGIALLSPQGPRRIELVQKYPVTEDGIAYDLVLDGDQTFFVEGFAVRSQHDNAHAVRYLPHLLRDTACMARGAAISAVYASVGIVMSPLAALAQGSVSASGDGGDGGGDDDGGG